MICTYTHTYSTQRLTINIGPYGEMVAGGDVQVGPDRETQREQLRIVSHGCDTVYETAVVLGNCKCVCWVHYG